MKGQNFDGVKKNLSFTIFPSTLHPLVTLVLQLTLYEQAKFAMISSSFKPDLGWILCVVFLPVMMGISLSSALMASGLGTAHWVTITTKLSEQVQKAIKDLLLSLTSLQCKIISVAQVLLQNGRALALLTADKGGTCMFLGDECCYYHPDGDPGQITSDMGGRPQRT